LHHVYPLHDFHLSVPNADHTRAVLFAPLAGEDTAMLERWFGQAILLPLLCSSAIMIAILAAPVIACDFLCLFRTTAF
jgi:hypothetical protein